MGAREAEERILNGQMWNDTVTELVKWEPAPPK